VPPARTAVTPWKSRPIRVLCHPGDPPPGFKPAPCHPEQPRPGRRLDRIYRPLVEQTLEGNDFYLEPNRRLLSSFLVTSIPACRRGRTSRSRRSRFRFSGPGSLSGDWGAAWWNAHRPGRRYALEIPINTSIMPSGDPPAWFQAQRRAIPEQPRPGRRLDRIYRPLEGRP